MDTTYIFKGGILGLTELGGKVDFPPPTSLSRDISKNSWRILTKFSEDFTGDQVAHFRYFPACPRQIGPPPSHPIRLPTVRMHPLKPGIFSNFPSTRSSKSYQYPVVFH